MAKRYIRFSAALTRHLTHQPRTQSSFGSNGGNNSRGLQDQSYTNPSTTANAYYKVNNQSAIDLAAGKVFIFYTFT